MTSMGRPKATWADLPRHMTARRSGDRVLYYYQAGGKKVPLGSDRAAALRQWAELEGQSGAGATLALVAAHYARVVMPTKAAKTQKDQLSQLKVLLGAMGHLPMASIRPALVRQYLQRRSAPIAANREVALLSHIWNWARGMDYVTGANPCQGIGRNRETVRRNYVTDEAFRAVRAQAPAWLADLMDLLLITGQRVSDVLRARLSDIRDGELWIRQSKTGAVVRLEVTGELRAYVDRARARTPASMYLVADSAGQRIGIWRADHAFKAARDAAGETWQLRDIRKKTITDEADISVASQRAGHADEAITARVYRLVKGRKVTPGRGI